MYRRSLGFQDAGMVNHLGDIVWEVGGVAEGRRFYSEWSSAMTFKDRLQGTERPDSLEGAG